MSARKDTSFRQLRKYRSHNPVQRWVLHRFHRRMFRVLRDLRPQRVLDFGCGEGLFWPEIDKCGALECEVLGIDPRPLAIENARRENPGRVFETTPLAELEKRGEQFDVCLAVEVLEHLDAPGEAICAMQRLAPALVLTVPWEPFFQLANFARGRDLRRLGNHPEHVQRWTHQGFIRFAGRFGRVAYAETCFPFSIIILVDPRQSRLRTRSSYSEDRTSER